MLESEALFLLVFSRIEIGVVRPLPVSYTEELSCQQKRLAAILRMIISNIKGSKSFADDLN